MFTEAEPPPSVESGNNFKGSVIVKSCGDYDGIYAPVLYSGEVRISVELELKLMSSNTKALHSKNQRAFRNMAGPDLRLSVLLFGFIGFRVRGLRLMALPIIRNIA